MSNKKIKCTVCGSTHTVKNGTRKLASTIYQQYKCNNCNSYFFKPTENGKTMVSTVKIPRETQVSKGAGAKTKAQTTERRTTRPSTRGENAGSGATQGGASKDTTVLNPKIKRVIAVVIEYIASLIILYMLFVVLYMVCLAIIKQLYGF